MRLAVVALVVSLIATHVAWANAPASSPRPQPNPKSTTSSAPAQKAVSRVQQMPSGVIVRIGSDNRPKPRPGRAGAKPVQVAASTVSIGRSPRPERRPRITAKQRAVIAPAAGAAAATKTTKVVQPAEPKQTRKEKRLKKRGSVCGVRSIRGEEILSIPAAKRGCGVSNPVRVTEVSGVRLSQASTMDCTTAKALDTWVENGVKPAVGKRGGGVAGLQIYAHYACRTRNNRPGAKVSEHGRGKAVDVGAILLADGSKMEVLGGWRDRKTGPVLKRMHKSACGPFGTVLGPNSDKYHQNHFHLDTASYRSGPYCR